MLNDLVIGTITNKSAEVYRVDIGWHIPAALNTLAFEGATRKNRPYLEIGSLVYARVSLADPFVEPELSCTKAIYENTADQSDNEALGEIKPGSACGIIRVTPSYAQQ